MSAALYRKSIHCSHCHYEGDAKVKGTGGGLAIFGIVSLIIGFWFWPLIIAILFFLVATFKPAKQVCPKCNWEYPVPLSQWEQQHVEEMACPFCAEPIRKEAIKCKHCGSEISVSTTRSNNISLQKQDDNYKDTLAYKAGKL